MSAIAIAMDPPHDFGLAVDYALSHPATRPGKLVFEVTNPVSVESLDKRAYEIWARKGYPQAAPELDYELAAFELLHEAHGWYGLRDGEMIGPYNTHAEICSALEEK